MKVTIDASVEDVLSALDLAVIPSECDPDLKMTDRVEITGLADEDEVRDDLPKIDEDRDDLADILDQTEMMDLAAAIRRGATGEAEMLLDRIFADNTRITEWVQLGRFSRKARQVGTIAEELKRAA